MLGLRTSKNLATSFSPFEVIYGFSPKLDAVNPNESCLHAGERMVEKKSFLSEE